MGVIGKVCHQYRSVGGAIDKLEFTRNEGRLNHCRNIQASRWMNVTALGSKPRKYLRDGVVTSQMKFDLFDDVLPIICEVYAKKKFAIVDLGAKIR